MPACARASPLFVTVAATVRFIGGFNLALAVLALLLLIYAARFPLPEQNAIFAITFAVAHGSQFAYNRLVLRAGGCRAESFWDLPSDPIPFIFVVDIALMIANGACALVFLAAS